MVWMPKYAYNKWKHSATGISLFYPNYSNEPRTNWPTKIPFRNKPSDLYTHYVTPVHTKLNERLETAGELMRMYYNKKRSKIEPFKKENHVLHSGKNICLKGGCRKLEDKMYRQFKVVSEGHNRRYCKVWVPDKGMIYLVFNIRMLEW